MRECASCSLSSGAKSIHTVLRSDRFTINIQPFAQTQEPLYLKFRDRLVSLRSHVQVQVAVLAYYVDERVNQFINRKHLLRGRILIVAKGKVDGPAGFPFESRTTLVPPWTKKFERECDRPVPEDADLREVATEILREVGLRESFFATRPKPNRINIVQRSFLSGTRLTYFIDEKRLLVENRRPVQLNTPLAGLHLRGVINRIRSWMICGRLCWT